MEMLETIPINKVANIDLYNKVIDINKALSRDSDIKLKTVVEFSLPLVLKNNRSGKIVVKFGKEKAIAEYSLISNNVLKLVDMDGLSAYTKWKIIFNSYISDEIKSIDIPTELDEKLIVVLNTIIQHYRIRTKSSWVRKIYPSMVTQKKIIYYAGNTIIRHILGSDNSTYEITQEQTSVDVGNIANDNYKLYEQLLDNAKSFLYSYSLRECVLSLNSSFENYIYEVVCPHIVHKSKGALKKDFYKEIVPYDDFNLKKYMSENQYQYLSSFHR